MANETTLDRFDAYTEVYKTVNGHDIKADILLPKGLAHGEHPVIIHWHGGGLVFGARDFDPFFQPWLHPFAEDSSAVIVSPDYRLAPESNAAEIIDDLESFWVWMKKDLPSIMQRLFGGQHSLDLSRLILSGGSAGGFCCAHLGLRHAGEIRAMMMQYPLVQLLSEITLSGNGGVDLLGFPIASREEVEAAVRAIKPGTYVSEGGSPERLRFGFSGIAWGFHAEWLGFEDQVNPTQCVKTGAELPPKIWVIQGSADEAVKINEVKDWVARVRKFCPQTEVMAEYFEGEGHGFDNRSFAPKLEGGLAFIRKAWLAQP